MRRFHLGDLDVVEKLDDMQLDAVVFFSTGTLPKTNIAPTNGWLEYYFPIGEAYFQGRLPLVSGRVEDLFLLNKDDVLHINS